MRKTIFLLFAGLLALTSCEKSMTLENPTNQSETSGEKAPVHLTFFDVSISDVTTPTGTRADEESSLKTNGYFKALDVTFIPQFDGVEVTTIHQESTDENFGKVDVSLPVGSYRLIAIAHRASEAVTIESESLAIFPGEKATDMAYISTTLDVNNTATTHVCQLERAMTCFCLETTDVLPANVSAVKVTFKNNCSWQFDPSTSFATNVKEYTTTVNMNSANVGRTRSIRFYTFIDQGTQYVDIHVDVVDAEGNALNQFDFAGVKLVQKKQTVYTGKLFSVNEGLTFESSISDYCEESGGSKEF